MTEAQTVSLMEARDRRSREVLESVMHSASLQEQIRQSMQEFQAVKPSLPWTELQKRARGG